MMKAPRKTWPDPMDKRPRDWTMWALEKRRSRRRVRMMSVLAVGIVPTLIAISLIAAHAIGGVR